MQPIVVIGTGLAGWSVVRELRKRAPDPAAMPITLVTHGSGDFYAKPSLSNAFAQGKTPTQLVSTPAEKMATTQQVQLLAHTRVLRIDTTAQQLHTSAGVLGYRQLVLASGAQPIRVPLQGDAAAQVLPVNSLEDFALFHQQLVELQKEPENEAKASANAHGCCVSSSENNSKLSAKKQIVIMGAGLIGCEFANDLVQAGHRVSVVDPGTRPLAALLPEEASRQLQIALSAAGVQWHWGCTVQAVNHAQSSTDAGRLALQLSNGSQLPADVVLSAIGLRADIGLAQAAGLRCERGICVDTLLQTSAAHVYALGDAAQYAHGATLPYVMPIMAAAKALAATLAGQPTPVVFPVMPVGIKTPALPLVVAPPPLGTLGQWQQAEAGIWRFVDAQGQVRGFALAGPSTARRAEQIKMLQI